jgi:PhzF family phenazine biosynthesis protein
MHLWIIDAFADRPFSGNPAAVCWMEGEREDGWHQAVAAEMNLAETAFLTARADGFGLRWFTPAVEVDLCGHATLASAQYLWESGRLPPGEMARFHTRSGLLTAARDGEWIVLDFPSTPPASASGLAGLDQALGVTPLWVGRTIYDIFVEVKDASQVRTLKPDLERLARIEARGIIVTAPGDGSGPDFISRFFAPASGIAEDPVTGSAHCALAPFWSERLGRKSLTGYQASRRGGTVRVELKGDRVLLGGRGVTVLRGSLMAERAQD